MPRAAPWHAGVRGQVDTLPAGEGKIHAMDRDLLQRHRSLRALLYLVIIIALLYAGGMIWSAIVHFSGILILFFLAWVIAFVLKPLSTFLERHRVPRILAITLIYFALLALVSGSIVLAFPAIRDEVAQVASEVTAALTPANLDRLSNMVVGYLRRLGLRDSDARELVRQFANRIPGLASGLANTAVNITTELVRTAMVILFDALVVLVLSFYIMLDGDRFAAEWGRKLPPAWLPDLRLLHRHIESIFGGFLRAAIIIAAVYGILTYLVLLIAGQPNGMISALLAALLLMVPFIGPVLALIPPALLVILQTPPRSMLLHLVIVVVALFVAQQIVMQVVAPRVMSAHVGLHPILLFAALLVGAQEGGVWGAIFAGPIAAVMVAMLDTFVERFQRTSPLYPHIPPGTVEAEGGITQTAAGRTTDEAREGAPSGHRLKLGRHFAIGKHRLWDGNESKPEHKPGTPRVTSGNAEARESQPQDTSPVR